MNINKINSMLFGREKLTSAQKEVHHEKSNPVELFLLCEQARFQDCFIPCSM